MRSGSIRLCCPFLSSSASRTDGYCCNSKKRSQSNRLVHDTLRRSSPHSRRSGKMVTMLPSPATKIYFTACHHLVSSSIQTLYPPSRSQRRRQSVRHDLALNVFLLTTVFQGSQTVVCTSLRETLLDLNTCRISMKASVRAKASAPPAPLCSGAVV